MSLNASNDSETRELGGSAARGELSRPCFFTPAKSDKSHPASISFDDLDWKDLDDLRDEFCPDDTTLLTEDHTLRVCQAYERSLIDHVRVSDDCDTFEAGAHTSFGGYVSVADCMSLSVKNSAHTHRHTHTYTGTYGRSTHAHTHTRAHTHTHKHTTHTHTRTHTHTHPHTDITHTHC